ncbi:hypothetical protein [Halococcus salsus]|uniref:hypothetical protein n=1 Tax=Halococcus salsus TaxID=2162894 RepID=UPI0013574F60|nr:hypothetical protein [Halococcus salsus]
MRRVRRLRPHRLVGSLSDGLLRLGNVGSGVYAFRARGRLDDGVSDVYEVNVANVNLFTVRDIGA